MFIQFAALFCSDLYRKPHWFALFKLRNINYPLLHSRCYPFEFPSFKNWYQSYKWHVIAISTWITFCLHLHFGCKTLVQFVLNDQYHVKFWFLWPHRQRLLFWKFAFILISSLKWYGKIITKIKSLILYLWFSSSFGPILKMHGMYLGTLFCLLYFTFYIVELWSKLFQKSFLLKL